MAVRPEILSKARRGYIVLDDASQIDHRSMVIRELCRVEGELARVIVRHLEVTRELPRGRAVKYLDGWGTKKLADLAFFLGLISEEDRIDILSLSRLRDRYAHDLERGQLDKDGEMFAFVGDTYLYKGTPEIRSVPPQGAFLAVVGELLMRMAEASSRENG